MQRVFLKYRVDSLLFGLLQIKVNVLDSAAGGGGFKKLSDERRKTGWITYFVITRYSANVVL